MDIALLNVRGGNSVGEGTREKKKKRGLVSGYEFTNMQREC